MKGLRETDYAKQMEEVVYPFLKAHKIGGQMECAPDQWPSAPVFLNWEGYILEEFKGTVVISHGFSESIQKYAEIIYYFLQCGYQVFGADHRGHGHSMRSVENPYLVYTARFEDYAQDLHTFVHSLVLPHVQDKPLFLFAHSMGGAVGCDYLERYPGDFERAVLSSPMLGIRTEPLPMPAAFVLAGTLRLLGLKKKAFGNPNSLDREVFENSATTSRARFDWYLKLRKKDPALWTISPTFGWIFASLKGTIRILQRKNCAKIQVPILLFSAEKDDFVRYDSQKKFVRRTKQVRIIRVKDARHELYNMPEPKLYRYMAQVLGFYGEEL